MTKAIILNKYRNELGRTYRKQYDNGLRTRWCNRSNMRSYQCRPNSKCGVVLTIDRTDKNKLKDYLL